MSRKTGVITINLNAGTAQFLTDMDKANAKIREFGGHSVSSMAAASGAVREFSGALPIRAVERFLSTTLGLGPVLEKAFPIVGGIAFGGMLIDVGKKAYEFYQQMRDAPARMDQAFRTAGMGLRESNDQLAVANDRLGIEIAHLEGRHENTLKLTLDEATRSADHLASSLEKDLESLKKLLKEEDGGFLQKMLSGSSGLETIRRELYGDTQGGYAGFNKQIEQNDDTGNAKVRAAKTKAASDAALAAMFGGSQKLYDAELEKFDKFIKAIQKHGGGLEGIRDLQGGLVDESDVPALLHAARTAREYLQSQRDAVGLQYANVTGTGRKDALEAGKANAQQDKPFADRMRAIALQIAEVDNKMQSIGQPESVRTMMTAFSEAQKAIEQTNKELEKSSKPMSDDEQARMKAAVTTLTLKKADEGWASQLDSTTASINEHVRALDLATAALGKGYDATRQASIETRLMSGLKEKYYDPSWLHDNQSDVLRMKAHYGSEFDSEHANQNGKTVQDLQKQIDLERELAQAQAQGAEAVRQATLAIQLRQLVSEGASREVIQKTLDLYNARNANAASTEVAKINERIEATQRLISALQGGAEAERQAALENKYAEIRRGGDTGGKKEAAERQADALEHQRGVTAEALRTRLQYQNQLESLNQQIAALKAIKATQGDNLAIEVSLQNLENQRLQVMQEQALEQGKLSDGFKAFMLEAQQDAKSPARIFKDSMDQAVDGVAENMSKLTSGMKTDWAHMFQSIGQEMQKEAYKGLIMMGVKGLGHALGVPTPAGSNGASGDGGKYGDGAKAGGPIFSLLEKMFGKGHGIAGVGKPDGSSPELALWVRMSGAAQSFTGKPDGTVMNPFYVVVEGQTQSPTSSAGNILGSIGGFLQAIGQAGLGGGGGSGGGGGTPSVTSSIDFGGFRADGGGVEPGHAYMVGERGPEPFVPRSAGTIIPNGKFGGDVHLHYAIDARGAALGTENRIGRAIEASHNSSVATGVRAMHERARRTPQK